MRISARWFLPLAVSLVAVVTSTSAMAATTLTASPSRGPAGTTVTLTYDTHNQGCRPDSYYRYVVFNVNGKRVGQTTIRSDCTARVRWRVPASGACPATYELFAAVSSGQQDSVIGGTRAVGKFRKTCPKPTPSPTRSPTPSPTRSPKPSPTATRALAPPPSSPTPPPPTTSASPTPVAVAAVPAADSGAARAWAVGGGVLGVLALGALGALVRRKRSAGP